MRRPIGIAAFVLAFAVLVALVLALRQGIDIQFPWSLIRSGTFVSLTGHDHLHHGHGSLDAKDIREVVVQAPSVGMVQLATASTPSVSWQWSASGPKQGVLAESETGGVLTLTYTPAQPAELNLGSLMDSLQVTLPPGLAANVSVATGTAKVSGTYRGLTASVTTGALSVLDFHGRLSASVDTGPLNITALQVTGPLTAQVGTGPLTFSGDPGLRSSFSVGTGPLTLHLSPRGSLAVRAGAHLGPLSSGFPGLQGGTNGVFRGRIGQGPSGSLTVDDGTGPVSIYPQ